MQGLVDANTQRFHRILGKGLKVCLQTHVEKEVLTNVTLEQGFTTKEEWVYSKELEEYVKTGAFYIHHPGTANNVDLYQGLLTHPDDAKSHVVVFRPLPKEVEALALDRKLNFVQLPNPRVLGLALGRFTAVQSTPETAPFTIMKNPLKERYVNLDCLFRSATWNPLFVKYRLSVVPSLQKNEYGYLRIDVVRNKKREIVVTASRASETEVPEFLKTAATFPQ